MGQPLYCSIAHSGHLRRERLWWWHHPLLMTQQYHFASTVPGFPPQAFPTTSPPSHPLNPQSTAALILGLHHNPPTPAPSYCAFHGTYVPVQGMYGCVNDSLYLIPFRLPHISCFTLNVKCFSSDSKQLPQCGSGTPASVHLPSENKSSPTNTSVFSP